MHDLARYAGVSGGAVHRFESAYPGSLARTAAKIAAAFEAHGVEIVAEPHRSGAIRHALCESPSDAEG